MERAASKPLKAKFWDSSAFASVPWHSASRGSCAALGARAVRAALDCGSWKAVPPPSDLLAETFAVSEVTA